MLSLLELARVSPFDARFREIRTAVIKGIAKAKLPSRLVLKGGNALNLLHKIGGRTSLDVDASLAGDLDDQEVEARAIIDSVGASVTELGLVLFDQKVESKPKSGPRANEPGWGGYEIRFKLRQKSVTGDLDLLRRSAETIGPGEERVFKIQLSKGEFFRGGEATFNLEGVDVLAYSPAMIAIEKLRAICQQMPGYEERTKKTARARDFYDIREVCQSSSVDLASEPNLTLLQGSFAAKRVSLSLLAEIEATRDFHRPDWPAVEHSVEGFLDDFDVYFDFVCGEVQRIRKNLGLD